MAIDRRPNRRKPWRARYWGPDGRQHSRSFARKADAQRWLAEVEHDKTPGQLDQPGLGSGPVLGVGGGVAADDQQRPADHGGARSDAAGPLPTAPVRPAPAF